MKAVLPTRAVRPGHIVRLPGQTRLAAPALLKAGGHHTCDLARRGCKSSPQGSNVQQESVVDQDFMTELNEVSNRTLEVLSSCQEGEAQHLSTELKDMQLIVEEFGDEQCIQFLRVLRGMLDHKILKEIDSLGGMYSRAADRILNQVAGSEWGLVEEGQVKSQQEPKFSTWDDVRKGKQRQAQSSGSVKDDIYYRQLGVDTAAGPADIKQAFRKLALKLHPDVNPAADAAEKFSEVSNAYDVLSDPASRKLYDLHGLEASSHSGSQAGRGNAREAWDEFKPFKRENKRTKARDAVRAHSSTAASVEPVQAPEGTTDNLPYSSLPQVGDVVEYPLRSVETEDFQDGRSHGVGLLVGRNMDRGDAAKLPEEQLDLCEIESLRQEAAESNRWIADDLGIPSFARLEELKIVPVSEFDKRFSIWTIDSKLSPGCGGPPLPEEVIL